MMAQEFRKFVVYCAVGFLATGAHYAVMMGLVHWAGSSEVLATCAGYIAGSIVKYPLNYGLVFSSTERHSAAVAKFVVALGIGFLLNAAVFALLLKFLDAYYMVSQVLTTGIVLFANYLLARYWIFFTRAGKESS
ncbi:MAG TPA: GtrA family protein [Usitatibacter sp.]|nr:GtrA family protein [Usitatibacter sp.]